MPPVQKAGRGLALTTAGESLLSYAKRILDLNGEAVDHIRGADIEGWVRLGLPQDFSETWLPSVLSRFACAHPKVRIEVQVDRSAPLLKKTLRGELEMALVWGDGAAGPHGHRIGDFPIAWIAALNATGIAWRLALTSPRLSGLWTAAEAGLGLTLRTTIGVPPTLRMQTPALIGACSTAG